MRNTAFISIGSNLGDRLNNCKKAISNLADSPDISVRKISGFYETEPWGNVEQDWFVNCAVQVETAINARDMLSAILDIEKRFGRKRSEKYGPRIIDLDILFFNNEEIRLNELIIPHPRLHERRFVLMPMNDIAPEFIHPGLKKTLRELLLNVKDDGKVKRL